MSTSYQAAPADGPRPVSGGRRFFRGLWRRLEQWWRWDEQPTAAAFREACEQRDQAQAEVRRLRVQLATAHADADSANEEVLKLAAVCARDLERVKAETAAAAASREKALIDTANTKTAARRD